LLALGVATLAGVPTPTEGLDALVCDLDGVLYRGDSAIEGSTDAIARARSAGVKIIFATNNATKTPADYVDKLASFGVRATETEIVTAAIVTAEECERRGWQGRSAFLIGGRGIREALAGSGMELLAGEAARRAELIVASNDPEFTYDHLRTAGFALHAGADFIATNGDPTFPASDGLWPGAGAVVAAVEKVAGRRAEVMGKPHKPMMDAIARRLEGCERIAFVGDQPATDLDGARSMGWITILVLSGVTDSAQAGSLDPQPDLILPSLAALELG
jgi:4-nitrophenyl phosphatase